MPLAVQQNRLPYHPASPPGPSAHQEDSSEDHLELCAQFMRLGQCRNAQCAFAHGRDELQQRKSRQDRCAGVLGGGTGRLHTHACMQYAAHAGPRCT